MPYGGGYSRLSSKNSRLNRYNFIKNSKRGAILIEFAFAVPVLFSLIYYVQDLTTIKKWQQRTDFATQCMANMFQNTQNIAKKDVIHIHHASRLSCVPDGVKSFEKWNKTHTYTLFQLGILCVVGTGENKCRAQWFAWSHGDDFESYYNAIDSSNNINNTKAWNPFCSLIMGHEYASNVVYPSLTINTDEVKILLIYVFCCQFAGLQNSWAQSILGLYVTTPIIKKYDDSAKTYLQSIVVFTPKPGTFDSNKPPQ